jgi:hypothetical protein
MTDNASDQETSRDVGFLAICLLVIITAVWLLLMPWVPSIARATINRFHLTSSSFAVWAIQFPIPTMYNFANRFEVREFPEGMLDPVIETSQHRYVNHFPSRKITFANTRYRYLNEHLDRWFNIDSSYRGQTIETRFHLKPIETGGFEVIRLSTEKVELHE